MSLHRQPSAFELSTDDGRSRKDSANLSGSNESDGDGASRGSRSSSADDLGDSSVKTGLRQRRWAPKVRTGCVTCRHRHVKCDELKPECQRCLSTGRRCDGYAPATSPAPAGSSNAKSSSSMLVNLLRQPVHAMVPPGVSWTQQHLGIFDVFRQDTIAKIVGTDRGYWTLNLLRAATKYPAIWHASLALAAMDKSCNRPESSPAISGDSLQDITQQDLYSFALNQYNESIQCLVGVTTQAQPSPVDQESMLLATVLYTGICFLQGDYSLGHIHGRSGFQLFNQWRFWERSYYPVQTGDRNAALLDSHPRITNTNDDCLFTADSLVTLMAHMESNFLTRFGHIDRSPAIPQSCSEMPLLSAVDAYFEFQPLFTGLLNSCHRVAPFPNLHLLADCITPSSLHIGNIDPLLIGKSERVCPQTETRREYVRELGHWYFKFAELQRTSLLELQGEREISGMSLLRVCWLCVEVCIKLDLNDDELAFDEHLSSFEQIINLADKLLKCFTDKDAATPKNGNRVKSRRKAGLASRRNKGPDNTSASNSPLACFAGAACELLFFVMRCCRDPALRQRAAGLLQLWPGAEGRWDNALLNTIYQSIVKMEHEPGSDLGLCSLCIAGAYVCGIHRVASTNVQFLPNGSTKLVATTVGNIKEAKTGRTMEITT